RRGVDLRPRGGGGSGPAADQDRGAQRGQRDSVEPLLSRHFGPRGAQPERGGTANIGRLTRLVPQRRPAAGAPKISGRIPADFRRRTRLLGWAVAGGLTCVTMLDGVGRGR